MIGLVDAGGVGAEGGSETRADKPGTPDDKPEAPATDATAGAPTHTDTRTDTRTDTHSDTHTEAHIDTPHIKTNKDSEETEPKKNTTENETDKKVVENAGGMGEDVSLSAGGDEGGERVGGGQVADDELCAANGSCTSRKVGV